MPNAYEVEDMDFKTILESPKSIVFKRKIDMETARKEIMNDRDIILVNTVNGKRKASHIPHMLLKHALYNGEIIFESGDD